MPGPVALPLEIQTRWSLLDPCTTVDVNNWQALTGGILLSQHAGNSRLESQPTSVRVQNQLVTGNIFDNKTQAVSYDVATKRAIMMGYWSELGFDNNQLTLALGANPNIYHTGFLAVTNAAGTKTFGHPSPTILQNGPNLLVFGRAEFQDTAATGMLLGTDDTRRMRQRFGGHAADLIDIKHLGYWATDKPRKATFILQIDDVWETGRVRLVDWYNRHGWRCQMSYAHGLQGQGHITPVATLAGMVSAGQAVCVNHSLSHVSEMVRNMTPTQWADDYDANAAVMQANGLVSVSKYGYRSDRYIVTPFGRLIQEKIDIGRARGYWHMSSGDGSTYGGKEQFWLNPYGFPIGYNLLASNNSEQSVRNTIRYAAAAGAVCIICVHGETASGAVDPSANYLQWRWVEEELLAAQRAGHSVGGTCLDLIDDCVSTFGNPPIWW